MSPVIAAVSDVALAAAITGTLGLVPGLLALWQARKARDAARAAREQGVNGAAYDRAQAITDRSVDRLERQLTRVEAELETERQARRQLEQDYDRLRRRCAEAGIREPDPPDGGKVS